MRAPEVSVLMPAYNAAPYLGRAIESVLSQSLSNIELIVVDDASTDSSAEIIKDYARADERIRPFFNRTNLGMAASLNGALTESRGSYCARMDADDESEPERLELQWNFLRRGGADLCGTAAVTFGNGRNRVISYPAEDEQLRVALMFQDAFIDPTVMVRTDLLRAVGGWPTDVPHAPDYDVWTRVALRGRLANLSDVTYRYRRHPGQMSAAHRLRQGDDAAVVKRRYLASLGFEPTAQELDAHVRLRYPDSFPSLELLATAEGWLEKLCKHFEDRPDLVRIVAEQWLRACIRAACFGLASFQRYVTSPLYRGYRPSLRETAELLLLCGLRIGYRSGRFDWLERFSRA